jgi:hypothetical protein
MRAGLCREDIHLALESSRNNGPRCGKAIRREEAAFPCELGTLSVEIPNRKSPAELNVELFEWYGSLCENLLPAGHDLRTDTSGQRGPIRVSATHGGPRPTNGHSVAFVQPNNLVSSTSQFQDPNKTLGSGVFAVLQKAKAAEGRFDSRTR